MARLTEKQTLMVIAGISLMLGGGAGGGVWWAKGLVEDERNQIAAKQQQIAAAQQKIKKIPPTINDVIVLRESVAEHVKILPNSAEIEDFFRATERFANSSGIGVDQFKPVRGGGRGGAFQRVSYLCKFEATLWQFMKFMNFFETYERFVKVRSFTLTSGGRTEPGEDARHNIQLTVETYLYTTKAAGKLAKINSYEQLKKKLEARIRNDAPLLLEEPYQFRGPQGRRDPFVDPRPDKDREGPGSIPLEQQKRIINDLGATVARLSETWTAAQDVSKTNFERLELRRKVEVGLKMLEPRINEIKTGNLITQPTQRARWFKEVMQPYKDLLAKATKRGAQDASFLSKAEFDSVVEKMKKALTSGNHENAVSQYQAVAEKVRVPASHPHFSLRNRIEGLALRARVAMEFAGKTLAISGVIVNEQGKSGVIINGEVYQEGEFIEENLFVKAVRAEEIEFVYRGFTLVKTF